MSYVEYWQKAMSDAHKTVNQNINKRNNSNKEITIKKVYGQNLVVGDRAPNKKRFWEGKDREVTKFWGQWNLQSSISTQRFRAIYQVQPEKGGSKIKTVYRNLFTVFV